MEIDNEMRIKKPVRTISGVTPLTVVLKPKRCKHGVCVYCPGGDDVPQSYTDKSPAVMRAMQLHFDPHEQVLRRLAMLEKMGHPTEKIEIIILGGTFLQYELDYQYDFIKQCFDALNGQESSTLEEAKTMNETSVHRCVALCIENRPDTCSDEDIKRMLEFGATRVELGVQILDDVVYKKINRGHTVQDVIDAIRRLREAGFKIGVHIMPGLPHSTFENDVEKFQLLFNDESYRPDQLKIYPCQIVEGAPLSNIYHKIKFVPYTDEETRAFLEMAMNVIPNYCRLMRVMREIPKEKMIGGAIRLDLRKKVEDALREQGKKVNEIRMREIGFNTSSGSDLKLQETHYPASGGDEYFLEIVDEHGVLFGLLRLRLSEKGAMVRELHVYGKTLNLGEKQTSAAQHSGLGKQLMDKAEEIARGHGFSFLRVISGVGVREYYRKLGYSLGPQKTYMVKTFL